MVTQPIIDRHVLNTKQGAALFPPRMLQYIAHQQTKEQVLPTLFC